MPLFAPIFSTDTGLNSTSPKRLASILAEDWKALTPLEFGSVILVRLAKSFVGGLVTYD